MPVFCDAVVTDEGHHTHPHPCGGPLIGTVTRLRRYRVHCSWCAADTKLDRSFRRLTQADIHQMLLRHRGRVIGPDGKPKPRWSLAPMMVGGIVGPLAAIPFTISSLSVLSVMLVPFELAIAVLSWLTYRVWDYSSRAPGTVAYDMRYGTDTVGDTERQALHERLSTPVYVALPLTDDERTAAAIRASVEATGDPYARGQDDDSEDDL